MQLESSRPVGVRTLAHFARRNLADKLRRQGARQVAALLGGWDEVRARLTIEDRVPLLMGAQSCSCLNGTVRSEQDVVL